MTDTCKHCGAWEGLHHWSTNQCPKNGKEALRGKQEWEITTFESDGTDEDVAKNTALEICVMFLTNTNTITEEKQTELVKHLRTAGMDELAEAVAIGGIASIFKETQ